MLSAIGTANSFKGNSHVKTSPKSSMIRSLAATGALMLGGTGLVACSQESPVGPKPAATLSQEALATAQETSKNTYAIYQNLGVPIEVTSSTSGPVAAARALASENSGDLYFSSQESKFQGQSVKDSVIGVQSDGGTRILTRSIDDIGDTTFSTTTRYPISNGYKSVNNQGGVSEMILNDSGATLNTYDSNGKIIDKNLKVVANGDTIFIKDSTGKIFQEETGVKTYFSKTLRAVSSLFSKPSISKTELAAKLETGAVRTLKVV